MQSEPQCKVSLYRNGHWIEGFVERADGTELCSLCVGLARTTSEPEESQCVQLGLQISIDMDGDAPEKKITATWFLKNGKGRGWTDFLNRKCPTIKEVVAPYLVDGKLTIEFEVNKVDKASWLEEEEEDDDDV